MERATAELIVKEMEKIARDFGFDFAELVAKTTELVSGRKASRPLVIRALEAEQSQLVESMMRERPEPSPEELARVLSNLRRTAPYLREQLKTTAKKLPAKAGGRDRLLDNKAEARLITMVSHDLATGVEKPEAIHRAAERFGVSYWTAKRAWKRYQQASRSIARKSGPNLRPRK